MELMTFANSRQGIPNPNANVKKNKKIKNKKNAYGGGKKHSFQTTYQMENVHNNAIRTTMKAIFIIVDST